MPRRAQYHSGGSCCGSWNHPATVYRSPRCVGRTCRHPTFTRARFSYLSLALFCPSGCSLAQSSRTHPACTRARALSFSHTFLSSCTWEGLLPRAEWWRSRKVGACRQRAGSQLCAVVPNVRPARPSARMSQRRPRGRKGSSGPITIWRMMRFIPLEAITLRALRMVRMQARGQEWRQLLFDKGSQTCSTPQKLQRSAGGSCRRSAAAKSLGSNLPCPISELG
jgi:hypothetical protein